MKSIHEQILSQQITRKRARDSGDLAQIGLLDRRTMKKFDAMCLAPVVALTRGW
jgi:hypothetical protein